MPIELIDDSEDPRLADYRNLTDTALRRINEPEARLYIAESVKVIARAVQAGHTPRSVLTQRRWIAQVEEVLAGRDTPVYVVADDVAERVTGYAVHRGALASMHRPALPTVAEVLRNAKLVLVLEDLIEHTNVGAAFRAAAGLGADAVLVSPRCADPLYRRAVKKVPVTNYYPNTPFHIHGFTKSKFPPSSFLLSSLSCYNQLNLIIMKKLLMLIFHASVRNDIIYQ